MTIEENELIDQDEAARLKGMGVEFEQDEADAARVTARMRAPIDMLVFSRICKRLHRLGKKGYRQDELRVRTEGDFVHVSITLLAA